MTLTHLLADVFRVGKIDIKAWVDDGGIICYCCVSRYLVKGIRYVIWAGDVFIECIRLKYKRVQ